MIKHFSSLLVSAVLICTAGWAAAQNNGGQLVVVLNPEPSNLILASNLEAPTQTVAGKIYQGLLTFNGDLKPLPSLAESWNVSADGRKYTFHLQPNVKWHDGKEFTSADVAFTLGKMLPETHPIARATLASIENIETPDRNTVVVTLKSPFSAFLTALAVNTAPMMPAHIYEGKDYFSNPANATPIGTGPFKFKEWKRGEYIRLTKNESYWKKGLPRLDEIVFRIIPDESSRVVALEQGNVDVTSFTDIEKTDVDRLEGNPRLVTTYGGYEFFSPLAWIELNNRKKPLSDKRFRQALMLAVDRKFLGQSVWNGIPAKGPIASTTLFYDKTLPPLGFDINRANTLLDEMGLARDAAGIRTTLSLIVPAYGTSMSRTGEYLKQAFNKIGVKVNLETLDGGASAERISQWNYDMAINYVYQLGHPAIGVSRTYISSNIRKVMFSNTMGYSNLKVDELFAGAAKSTNSADTSKNYNDVQKLLVEEAPNIWLIELKFPTIYSKRVHDLITTAHGINDGLESTWVDKREQK